MAAKNAMLNEALQRARELAGHLKNARLRVVFAESCTAGWVSALLSSVPGISNHLCGSFVTYREASKQAWLGVSSQVLAEHSAESAEATREMVVGTLKRTPEAQWAAAVTGHVGPGAPAHQDGVCFIAVAKRDDQGQPQIVLELRYMLRTPERLERQQEAATLVLESFVRALADE